ncbi:hypothetical protein LPJ55_000877 [Coemansia sp. RSA 990]|nr:hypothetical protein BX667DRAFT_513898 [Coemansia mojavensis]KAJ1742430.1 hypothetical protein LPJ68_001939 [Coemansia sp. RSA 1086]KAJ1875205.1 hypothetical protein LPJ55_000877 [Coemansia sp. RSA 990]KAJ2671883.1 hypothetical protein IWW42_003145 [Coemansia sp. RSA 1085]
MELRNRPLSEERSVDESAESAVQDTAKDDIVAKEEAMEENDDSSDIFESTDMDIDGAGDMSMEGQAFLGDFEEIEEDEDVERFMSQNNTPSASTRQSPKATAQSRKSVEMEVDDSSDEDEIFETISEQPPAASTADAEMPKPQASQFEWYLPAEELDKLRSLQQDFQQRNVPELPSGLFLSADVYKRYSVLEAVSNDKAQASVSTSAVTSPKSTPTQKPSSLRSNGRNEAKSVAIEKPALATANEPAKSASKPRSDQDKEAGDVVDTLLGAMSSPKIRKDVVVNPPKSRPEGTIPNDMLVAMAAIEGNEAPKPPPAPVDDTAKLLAQRLPSGYMGPFSQLNTAEHGYYLSLLHRSKAGQLNGREAAELARLRPRVEAEQQKFKEQARAVGLDRVRRIRTDVNSSACAALGRHAQAVREAYPQNYRASGVRAIRPSAARYVALEYREMLFQRGSCGHVVAAGEKLGAESDAWAGEANELLLSYDTKAAQVAEQAAADVVVSDTTLAALLTLPQSFARDVVVPFTVSDGARRVVTIDDIVEPASSATPRRLNELFYTQAARRHLKDSSRALQLGANEGHGDLENATYTLWDLGGLRVVVRYVVHAFEHRGDMAATVTLTAKVEAHAGSTSAETAAAGGTAEETTERERLTWWALAYLRGNASEVRVVHVDTDGAVVRTTRHTAADLGADAPPTRAIADMFRDLTQLDAGQYLLVHKRRTWDATVYRALDEAPQNQQRSGAVLDLSELLAPVAAIDAERADVEADYVPVAWHVGPAHIPLTYPPADVAEHCTKPSRSVRRKKQKKRRVKKP